jgi:hypothetical protein
MPLSEEHCWSSSRKKKISKHQLQGHKRIKP